MRTGRRGTLPPREAGEDSRRPRGTPPRPFGRGPPIPSIPSPGPRPRCARAWRVPRRSQSGSGPRLGGEGTFTTSAGIARPGGRPPKSRQPCREARAAGSGRIGRESPAPTRPARPGPAPVREFGRGRDRRRPRAGTRGAGAGSADSSLPPLLHMKTAVVSDDDGLAMAHDGVEREWSRTLDHERDQ